MILAVGKLLSCLCLSLRMVRPHGVTVSGKSVNTKYIAQSRPLAGPDHASHFWSSVNCIKGSTCKCMWHLLLRTLESDLGRTQVLEPRCQLEQVHGFVFGTCKYGADSANQGSEVVRL